MGRIRRDVDNVSHMERCALTPLDGIPTNLAGAGVAGMIHLATNDERGLTPFNDEEVGHGFVEFGLAVGGADRKHAEVVAPIVEGRRGNLFLGGFGGQGLFLLLQLGGAVVRIRIVFFISESPFAGYRAPGNTPLVPGIDRITGMRSGNEGSSGKSVYGSVWYQ